MSAFLTISAMEDQHTIQQMAQHVPHERLASWRGSGRDGLTADRYGKQVRSA